MPERLYPWLSFLSGLIVVDIGLRLLTSRLRQFSWFKKSSSSHTHDHHSHDHSHDHSYDHSHHPPSTPPPLHSHNHSPDHSHHHPVRLNAHGEASTPDHTHSHLPPGADGSPVTWRNLLALGISGGIVPCPSALVVLLSMVAIGQVGFGLVLVSAFSLGLAGALTSLGVMLVSARRLFERVPTQLRLAKALPTISALFITLLGLGISAQAVMQIGLVKL
ncbi:MAG: sulfite exporter TauE/SafE family protein [Leptolyngbyaceae cyanobacterium CAN_BIN12]|nr:sulfite exporter TauE/SafE family protein [Leptolyngbyaceae cyanobacterium CAN_BIN12]